LLKQIREGHSRECATEDERDSNAGQNREIAATGKVIPRRFQACPLSGSLSLYFEGILKRSERYVLQLKMRVLEFFNNDGKFTFLDSIA
jgi:hypothetical protein